MSLILSIWNESAYTKQRNSLVINNIASSNTSNINNIVRTYVLWTLPVLINSISTRQINPKKIIKKKPIKSKNKK